MQLFRMWYARVLAWHAARRARRWQLQMLPHVVLQASIHREVTAAGVRVFSLCGSCGARLSASATLCEECAQRRSRLP
jgi:ribosomal protein L40E